MLQFAMRERIVNYYWKLRRYYWKYKFAIRKPMILTFEYMLSVKLLYWKARKAYDIGRLFLIRLFWKIKGALNYVSGYCVGYIRHFSVTGYWKIRHFSVIGYWKLRRLINRLAELRPTKFFYPFKKTYWFLSYQVQKRLFPIFRKKTRND